MLSPFFSLLHMYMANYFFNVSLFWLFLEEFHSFILLKFLRLHSGIRNDLTGHGPRCGAQTSTISIARKLVRSAESRAVFLTCGVTDSGEGALQSVLNKLSWLFSCSGGHGIKHQGTLMSLQETSALILTYANDHDLDQAIHYFLHPTQGFREDGIGMPVFGWWHWARHMIAKW